SQCMGAVFSAKRKGKMKMKSKMKQQADIRSPSITISTSEELLSGSLESETYGDSSDYTTSSQITSVTDESRTGTRSHNTSYGVQSLPEVKDYPKWRKKNIREDEKWLGAMRQFNDMWPVHRRQSQPAKLVRRLIVARQGINWAKAAREVYKRQNIEWEVESNEVETITESLSIHTFSDVTDSLDESSVESSSST
ncbi:hypothetical protein PENTCL1PPCAC_26929, partial [Pristionchus entomophagus]